MSDTPTPRSTAAIAYEALNLSKQNERDIEKHEDLCAERYANINITMAAIEQRADKGFTEIKGILKWAGGTLFAIIISLLGFLATQQFNANDSARRQAESKIELLERQILQQARPTPAAPQP